MTRESILNLTAAALTAIALTGCHSNQQPSRERDHMPATTSDNSATPDSTLDALHDAASRADFERYFSLFAPDAVFLGTDASERWTLDQFKAYTKPFFDQGRGWTYIPSDRHITIAPDGLTAWFDERVTNAKYGECRGTGVLLRTGRQPGGWKIAQYNLAKPIPNDLFEEIVNHIRESGKGR